jgi:uncharacterized membrane protein HdeD (DUF308 family)
MRAAVRSTTTIQGDTMKTVLGALRHYVDHWWVLAVRGVAAIIFGLIALFNPGITLGVLVALFGAFLLVDGIVDIVGAFKLRGKIDRWWALLLEGVVDILIAAVAFLWPESAAMALVFFIGFWALLIGILEIWFGLKYRKEMENEWVLILAGVLAVIFGLTMFVYPAAGALSLIWLIGSFAIAFGAAMFFLSFRLKGLKGRVEEGVSELKKRL